MSEKPNQKPDEKVIGQVVNLCADRGASAMLRRYWSDTTRHYAYPVLARLPVSGFDTPDALAAALYAVNPNHRSGGLRPGQALSRLASDGDIKSFERHFRRLLASETLDEVAGQLHRLFKRLERETIALDFNCLLWDLRNWRKDRDGVRTRWATDFWLKPGEIDATEASATSPTEAPQTVEASA